jgi:hypothetical protein
MRIHSPRLDQPSFRSGHLSRISMCVRCRLIANNLANMFILGVVGEALELILYRL